MRCACFQWEDGKSHQTDQRSRGTAHFMGRCLLFSRGAAAASGLCPQAGGISYEPCLHKKRRMLPPRGAYRLFAFVSCIRAERKKQGLTAKGLPGPVAFQKPVNGEPGLGHPLRQPYSALGSRSTKMALETKKPLGVKRQTPFS